MSNLVELKKWFNNSPVFLDISERIHSLLVVSRRPGAVRIGTNLQFRLPPTVQQYQNLKSNAFKSPHHK
jgi:hypothetical protein